MRDHLRAACLILALMVVVGIALTDVFPLPLQLSIPKIIIVGLIVAATFCVMLWFIFFNSDIVPPTDTALGPPNPTPPSKSELANEYAVVTRSYKRDAIELLSNMLGNLPHYLTRIDDHIEILADTPQLRVTRRQTYQIGKNAPKVSLVPIARIQKGTLFDNFMVKDVSGGAVLTLPYNRMRGLLAVTLEVLVETAVRSDIKAEVIEEHRPLVNRVLRDLVIAVCGPGPLNRLSKRHAQIEASIKAALGSIDELPISDKWKSDLRSFCEQYVDYYVIVAEVPKDKIHGIHLGLSYSHRVPFENISGHAYNHWREQFGLKPSIIDIPLHPYAFLVEAYHQEIDAEPGQYIFDHHLERLTSKVLVTQDDLPSTAGLKPYVRLYHDQARPNAHLYIRRQLTPQSPREQSGSSDAGTSHSEITGNLPDPVKSVIKLREIPPGTWGAVTTIALASATIISFFAITHIGLDINPNATNAEAEQIKATLNSDVPALLLALPAFVGVLIGSWLDLSHLRRASLTTYLSLVLTMFLSLASALFFVYDVNRMLSTSVTLTTVGGMKIYTDWIWLGLMTVAITHFFFLLRRVVDESRHYAVRVKQRIDKTGENGV